MGIHAGGNVGFRYCGRQRLTSSHNLMYTEKTSIYNRKFIKKPRLCVIYTKAL